MADSPAVLQACRDALDDPRRYFTEELTGTGRNSTFRLNTTNIDKKDLQVFVADNSERPFVPNTSFTVVDDEEGYIKFSAPPKAGSIIQVEGWYWDWFTDAKLKRYIGYAATNYGRAEGEDRFNDLLDEDGDFGTILGWAGAVEALWAQWTRFSREIDVSSPEVSIPARQRFQQVGQLLDAAVTRLTKAEQALNIGRYRIEVLTLRRVSMTTGRLVPIFKPQEIDDFQIWPERILPPIDDGVVP